MHYWTSKGNTMDIGLATDQFFKTDWSDPTTKIQSEILLKNLHGHPCLPSSSSCAQVLPDSLVCIFPARQEKSSSAATDQKDSMVRIHPVLANQSNDDFRTAVRQQCVTVRKQCRHELAWHWSLKSASHSGARRGGGNNILRCHPSRSVSTNLFFSLLSPCFSASQQCLLPHPAYQAGPSPTQSAVWAQSQPFRAIASALANPWSISTCSICCSSKRRQARRRGAGGEGDRRAGQGALSLALHDHPNNKALTAARGEARRGAALINNKLIR